jgi:hypothetical protein
LPFQLSTRDEDTVTRAVSSIGSLPKVDAIFYVTRDTKQSHGSVVPVHQQVRLGSAGFPFQLKNNFCVPAVVWEGQLPVRPPRPQRRRESGRSHRSRRLGSA